MKAMAILLLDLRRLGGLGQRMDRAGKVLIIFSSPTIRTEVLTMSLNYGGLGHRGNRLVGAFGQDKVRGCSIIVPRAMFILLFQSFLLSFYLVLNHCLMDRIKSA